MQTFFKGEKAAVVGRSVLYKSDIEKIIPPHTSAEDSTALARQYIDSWALKRLMLLKAQEQLSPGDKDVAQQLEEYKSQLLIFRYENKIVEEKLDTSITQEECAEYYRKNAERFRPENGLARARIVKVDKSSPNLQRIRKLISGKDSSDMVRLRQVVKVSAYSLADFDGRWVDMSLLAREMGVDLGTLQLRARHDGHLETTDSMFTHILQISDYVAPGGKAPFEYCREKIKEMILAVRKRKLLNDLHKEIFNNALDTKELKIINNESD
ncbi:MAG: hypothetical protein LKI53_05645 [Bacteroidales bacterium]|jgi:hypothetical protein|nr:hypothetical protein [Bacteroidales bacterium]